MLLKLSLILAMSAYALVNEETEKAAERLGASYVTQVDFKQGNWSVGESSQKEISKLVQTARARGGVEQVTVIAWADKEYPTTGERPSDKQVELAERRAEEIRKVLSHLKESPTVKVYNMAKRPNALQELLQTPAAKVKDTMEQSGAAPTTGEDTGLFGTKSKAASAVVLVYTEKAVEKK